MDMVSVLLQKCFNPHAVHYSFTALLKECNFKIKILTHYKDYSIMFIGKGEVVIDTYYIPYDKDI